MAITVDVWHDFELEHDIPDEWRVWDSGDGWHHETRFYAPDAEKRARAYAWFLELQKVRREILTNGI